MKKVIALMLCLLMVASMVACGSQSATTEESNASTEQNETTAPATEETEQPEETSEPEETQSAEPTFDTSWAGDEYVMPIPEPPFTQFSVEDMDGAFMISSTSGDEMAQLTEEDIISYCGLLKSCLNFTEIHSEEHFEAVGNAMLAEKYQYTYAGYHFIASREDGLDVEIQYIGSSTKEDFEPSCTIVVIDARQDMTEDLQETQAPTENETAANNSIDIEAVVLPALPEGNWEKEQFNDDTYIMTIESIEYAEIDKYIGELYEEDFSISEIEAYSGGYGEYQAEKGIGNTFIKVNIQYGNDGTDCRIAVTVKKYS